MTPAISDAAFNLIVTEEASDQAYYTRHYQHWDWPAGASGPTIGIGYDCGYVTRNEARADWTGLVDDLTVQKIVNACGLRGQAAAHFVNQNRNNITIPWDTALKQFRERELPKWIDRVVSHVPNCDKLSPDSFGALVSLAYNRGVSFDLPGPRYAEMRAIKELMAASKFRDISPEFISMRRLWPPPGSDLWRRRGHEAALFQRGLAA